jgi:site-specific recombinase XerD
MQFGVAVRKFLRFCVVERQLSPHTLEAYAGDLHDLGKWLPAGMATADITPEMLGQYLSYLVAERGLSPATIRRRIACLRAFFRQSSSICGEENPFATWRPAVRRRRRLPRALSRREASSLVVFTPPSTQTTDIDGRFRTALRLMISTGVRVGELCRLRVEDVAPDASVIRIHGKGARERIAYIADTKLKRELQLLVRHHVVNGNVAGPLFVNRRGSPLKPQSIRSKLRRHAREAGLTRRVTPHMLRHTAATLLIESGVDIRFVQRLLGHSSIATTEIYTHVSDEALRTTLERADVLGMLAQR